jgi:hypothetical protein
MLKENNTRKGFLKKEQFVKLANACANRGLWLRTILELTDSYGCARVKSSICGSSRST